MFLFARFHFISILLLFQFFIYQIQVVTCRCPLLEGGTLLIASVNDGGEIVDSGGRATRSGGETVYGGGGTSVHAEGFARVYEGNPVP